ncbi:MAG: hypothetical protein RLZZ126_753 [Pseudomonadota bacterium]|jgi:type IV pilus assembly protein PilF
MKLSRIAFLASAAVLALWLLAGCAGNNPDGSSGRADLQTESDEPEARKRARIRLELAVGYFEQGKTTVALDEIKLAIAADPTMPDAYNVRGLIYQRLADAQLAEESFRRALALRPNDGGVIHNLAFLHCQNARYPQAEQAFGQALAAPGYTGRAKTYMVLALCQEKAGKPREAEDNLQRSYDIEPGNPIVGYNLAKMLHQRGETVRAQFIVRRVNNSEFANAETLWLGIKVENRMNNRVAAEQLAAQLKKRFPQSREMSAYDRGAFNE